MNVDLSQVYECVMKSRHRKIKLSDLLENIGSAKVVLKGFDIYEITINTIQQTS